MLAASLTSVVKNSSKPKSHQKLFFLNPQLLGLRHSTALGQPQVVQGRPFEVLTPQVHQTFARLGVKGFVGTEEGPVLSPEEAPDAEICWHQKKFFG